MLYWAYILIALLILVLTVHEFWKNESFQMKICACFVIMPLVLRVLMLK